MSARIALAAWLAALVVIQTGCSSRNGPVALAPVKARPATDITASSYAAADALMAQIKPVLELDTPLIVASVVNLNRLDESSPLGRLIAEQVAGRFTQAGYRVLEVKLRNQLYLKRNEGDLVLTREIRDIAKQHHARAIVAGTYADSADRVFVNMKIIEFETNVVLAAFDYQMEKDTLVRSLLVGGGLATPGSTPR